jgi:NADH-quinone oxidoreductase subunit D/NADH-quinone oxidoreductase subunit C/D
MYRQTDIIKDSSQISPPVGGGDLEGAGDLVINVGPQHPSTHGVLHLVITLNGETIKKVEPHLGFIHRSIEKMCESLSYRQFIYVTSRMDYLSSHINNHGCALCVEKGLQVEIPPRAQVIRVLMDELTRIASHELWWGAMAMDLGAFTPFFSCFPGKRNHQRYYGGKPAAPG